MQAALDGSVLLPHVLRLPIFDFHGGLPALDDARLSLCFCLALKGWLRWDFSALDSACLKQNARSKMKQAEKLGQLQFLLMVVRSI